MEFHRHDFYFTTLTAIFSDKDTFLYLKSIDPYFRKFVRYFYHSHHICFIDPRPMGYTIRLRTAFVLFAQITVSLSRLYRAFNIHITTNTNANRSIRESVSGRYSFIPLFRLSVLLIRTLRSFISA